MSRYKLKMLNVANAHVLHARPVGDTRAQYEFSYWLFRTYNNAYTRRNWVMMGAINMVMQYWGAACPREINHAAFLSHQARFYAEHGIVPPAEYDESEAGHEQD